MSMKFMAIQKLVQSESYALAMYVINHPEPDPEALECYKQAVIKAQKFLDKEMTQMYERGKEEL